MPAPPPPPMQSPKEKRSRRRTRRYQRPVFKEPGSKMKSIPTDDVKAAIEQPAHNTGRVPRPIPIVENFRDELRRMTSQDEGHSAMCSEEERYRSAVRARVILEKHKDDKFDLRSIHNRIPSTSFTEEEPDVPSPQKDLHRRVSTPRPDAEPSMSSLERPVELQRELSDLSQFLYDFGEKMGIVRRRASKRTSSKTPPNSSQRRNDTDESSRCLDRSISAEEDDIRFILAEHRELPDACTGTTD